ncbi:hypothetical protein EVAR_7115_1 [Eumeta japonica]|uniref:Uncharacterized protein n=1 Tax=Eumeta variegata TaxID=151549 RepID=A0A4C1U6A5_EUMVA|nr:hypothetical protein EVAR_7115_1 [Eumeta japonica]
MSRLIGRKSCEERKALEHQLSRRWIGLYGIIGDVTLDFRRGLEGVDNELLQPRVENSDPDKLCRELAMTRNRLRRCLKPSSKSSGKLSAFRYARIRRQRVTSLTRTDRRSTDGAQQPQPVAARAHG